MHAESVTVTVDSKRTVLTPSAPVDVKAEMPFGNSVGAGAGGGVGMLLELKLNDEKDIVGAARGEKRKHQTHQVGWQQRQGRSASMLTRAMGKAVGGRVDGYRGLEGRLRAHTGYFHEDDVAREVVGVRARSSA